MFLASTYSFMVGLLPAMGVHAEPSLIRTLSGACGLTSLLDEVWTLPGEHSPWSLRTLHRWLGGEETGAVAAGEFPKVPPRVFFFLGKSCSILQLCLYKEGPVLSHSPPLQLDWGLSRSGPHTAQLSTLPSLRHGLCGFTT